MKKKTHESLKKKGWSQEDINKAEKIIAARHRHDKSASIPTSNKVVFWTVFVIIILLNFLISLTLVPFLLVAEKLALNFIIILIAVIFGILFTFLINLAHISRSHHVLAGIIIPVIALLNFVLIAYLANVMNNVLQLTEVRQSPVVIGAIYVVAFIAPFLIDMILRKYFGKE